MGKITRTRVPAESYDVPETEDVNEDVTSETEAVDSPPTITSGWIRKPKSATFRKTVKAPYLNLKAERGDAAKKHIIKILNDEPPATHMQHYINSQRKGFTCMQERDDKNKITVDCPLCLAGHRANPRFLLNVVDLTEDPEVVLKWEFGNEVFKQLEEFLNDDDKMFVPLNREDVYFQAYHSTVEGRTAPKTNVLPLRAKYLEDYNQVPLTSEELEELAEKCYGKEVIWIHSQKDLEEAAATLTAKDTEAPTWSKK